MSKVIISINTDNAAFGDEPISEIAKILKKLVYSFESSLVIEAMDDKPLMDHNGNTVGRVFVHEEDHIPTNVKLYLDRGFIF